MTAAKCKAVTLKEALEVTILSPQTNLGVLYLPKQPWTLSTKGMFFDPDIDLDPNLDQTPEEIRSNGWEETLDTDLIDQIIFNAKAQKTEVTIDELFQAFVYYFNEDAFLRFE